MAGNDFDEREVTEEEKRKCATYIKKMKKILTLSRVSIAFLKCVREVAGNEFDEQEATEEEKRKCAIFPLELQTDDLFCCYFK